MSDMQDHISCYLNGKSIVAGMGVVGGRIARLYPVRIYTDTLILHLQTSDIPSLEKAVSELHALKAEREINGGKNE